MKLTKRSKLLLILLLIVFSIILIIKATSHNIYSEDKKEKYQKEVDETYALLDPFLKEKEKRGKDWTYPDFYIVLEKGSVYEKVLIHYRYHPCYPIYVNHIFKKEEEENLFIYLSKTNKLDTCAPNYTSDYEVITLFNPNQRPLDVLVDTSYGFQRKIKPLDHVLKELKEEEK